ncbi:hypothetical protein RHSIM_Rhsim12G0207100 [Rhododendron simsii]|uniref:Uncharacterized protein n=1 Tax=Rhododendron simsii TaxID=118357 RepID=A0A834L9U8_RHOSS|nr:hypothetical protein RHSIM_Rhsim12G0207100 [Rhododendron simsii]
MSPILCLTPHPPCLFSSISFTPHQPRLVSSSSPSSFTTTTVVSLGTISAPMFSMEDPSMEDLRLALGLAESVSQLAQIAAPTNKLYKVGKSCGLSDKDFSAVTEALKFLFLSHMSYVGPQIYDFRALTEEMVHEIDVAFAMLADPESAMRIEIDGSSG